MHKRVTFHDETYWLTDGYFSAVKQLCPLDHYDEQGNLLADPFTDICFAIVTEGKVIRFEQEIGNESEIKDVIEA